LGGESLIENVKIIERYLVDWPSDEEAWAALWLLYDKSVSDFGYEFIVRKRILKRIWSCITQELKKCDERVQKDKASH
jgi:hypothetical protein